MPPIFRAPAFGLTMAAFYLAFSMSPSLVTLASKRVIPLFSYVTILVSFFFVLFFVPETLPSEVSRNAAMSRGEERMQKEFGMNVYERVLLRPFRDLSILNRSTFSRIIVIMAILSAMVYSSDKTVLLYYIENHLDFNIKDVANYFLVHGLAGIIVQTYILKQLTASIGERYVLIMAYSIGAIYNFLFGIANNKAIIYLAGLVSAFSAMAYPTLTSINSYNGTPLEQGLLQGALASVGALAEGFGPLIMTFVYNRTKDGALFGAGTMFFVGTTFFAMTSVFAYILPAKHANSRKKNTHVALNQMVLLDNDHLNDEESRESEVRF